MAAYDRRRQGADVSRGRKTGATSFRGRPIRSTSCGPTGRPRRSRKVEIHPIEFAGELAKDKLSRLAAAIAKEGATHAVLTDPSSLAWTFNIRGGDVPHTPLALGFAVLAAEGPHLLFMDKRKLPIKTEAYLTQLADLRPPSALEAEIAALAKGGAKIALDPVLAADRLRTLITRERRRGRERARSCPHPARHQEQRRDRRRARRAPPRRRGGREAAVLARQPGAGHARRDRRRDQARGNAPRHRRRDADAAARSLLRHHRGRRPERRDHALPRFARHQPAARAAASFSCSIPAGSTRTARPTSPAPCRSASRPRRCAPATRWC